MTGTATIDRVRIADGLDSFCQLKFHSVLKYSLFTSSEETLEIARESSVIASSSCRIESTLLPFSSVSSFPSFPCLAFPLALLWYFQFLLRVP